MIEPKGIGRQAGPTTKEKLLQDTSLQNMENRDRQADGTNRKVGVELEFGGLDLERICEIVQEAVGGKVKRESRYAAIVHDTKVGEIKVKLDTSLFSEFKLRGMLRGLPITKDKHELTEVIEEALASEAKRWVPFELAFEPVVFDRIGELDAVTEVLSREAEGTGTGIFNAFALHFNPELPQVDVATVLCYLRAFLVLYESLKASHEIDMTRRITPFITPFPRDYLKLVLDPTYEPDEAQLISDYLKFNPTRNRALDLLPLFAHMNEKLVRRKLPSEKINARPTLHYRLPNSRVDDREWSISREWQVYLEIENLVNDANDLARRVRAVQDQKTHPIRAWIERCVHKLREFFSGR